MDTKTIKEKALKALLDLTEDGTAPHSVRENAASRLLNYAVYDAPHEDEDDEDAERPIPVPTMPGTATS